MAAPKWAPLDLIRGRSDLIPIDRRCISDRNAVPMVAMGPFRSPLWPVSSFASWALRATVIGDPSGAPPPPSICSRIGNLLAADRLPASR